MVSNPHKAKYINTSDFFRSNFMTFMLLRIYQAQGI